MQTKTWTNQSGMHQSPQTYGAPSLVRDQNTHSLLVGYLLWVFGFTGAHRFYYGKQITGTIWFLTGGLLLIGWIVDFFLIPKMDEQADLRYVPGSVDYTVAWILLTFLGVFGAHRFYMGKWISGIVWLLTGGLLLMGWLYDLWTLNGQVSAVNSGEAAW